MHIILVCYFAPQDLKTLMKKYEYNVFGDEIKIGLDNETMKYLIRYLLLWNIVRKNYIAIVYLNK